MKKYANKYKKNEKSYKIDQSSAGIPITTKNVLICLFVGLIMYSCLDAYHKADQKKKLNEQKKVEWCKSNPAACARYKEELKRWYDCQGLRNVMISAGSKVGKLTEDCPLPDEPWQRN